MRIHLITSSYDSGHAGARMGRGPDAFLDAGLVNRIEQGGHTVEHRRVEDRSALPTENATAFRLARAVARHVRSALWKRDFPMLLTGNCFSSLGVVAGLGTGRRGLVWLDAHGDMHTPETTTSGFLDGMPVAAIVGHCWERMAGSIEGFAPLGPEDVVCIGAHDMDAGEDVRFREEGGTVLGVEEVRAGLAGPAIAALADRVDDLYLHLDLDVLDVGEGRANPYAVEGGLRRHEVLTLLGGAVDTGAVSAFTMSAYDPACDVDGRVRAIGLEAVAKVLGAA